MPCLIEILTPQGLKPAPYTADSLASAAQHEPHDGVYTVTNTYHVTQVLKMDAHLDRLEDSAQRAQIALQLDRARLRAALRDLIVRANWGDVRFRITVPAATPDQLILSVEPFSPLPATTYSLGVRCVTVPGGTRNNPTAKTTDWMQDRGAIERDLPSGIFTGLLLDTSGHILEGVSSNFYTILDGELWTAGGGVLPGIAQQVVLEIAPAVLPVRREAPAVSDTGRMAEAFITSASRGIVPVVEIDGIALSGGKPGPQTQALWERYQSWVGAHLEEM